MWLWVFIPPGGPALQPTPTLPQPLSGLTEQDIIVGKYQVTCQRRHSNRCSCQGNMSGAQLRSRPGQNRPWRRRLGHAASSSATLISSETEHTLKSTGGRSIMTEISLGLSNRFWQQRISCQSPVSPGLREHGSIQTHDLCLDFWSERTDLSILLSAYMRDDNYCTKRH